MKVLSIYGNPKDGGFVHGAVDTVSDHLAGRGVDVERIRLMDRKIAHCKGCFTCLAKGACVIDDDMTDICARIREADGLVVGCSVRNGHVTALYKKFYERITYTLNFPGDISDKYVLGVSAVGMAGGARATRSLVGMADGRSRLVRHLFFRRGIPSRDATGDEKIEARLKSAAEDLDRAISTRKTRGLVGRVGAWFDRLIMRKLMFEKQPDTFAAVIDAYRRRGWMRGGPS